MLASSGAVVAIVNRDQVARRTQRRWIEAGTWTVKNPNVTVVGDGTVVFYAADRSERDRLIAHLRNFAPSLPRGVLQAGPYVVGPGFRS